MFILFYVYLVRLTSSPSSSSSTSHFDSFTSQNHVRCLWFKFAHSFLSLCLSRSLPVCPLILRVFVTFLKTWKLDRLIWISLSFLLRLYVKYLVRLSVMLALVFFLVHVLVNLLFRIYSRLLLKICYYYSMLV